jgi:hypothetical protein
MPADLDELFITLGAHADRIPLGTPENARRRGQRRRRRVVAAGLALVAVATASTVVAVAQLALRPVPPATPTFDFIPLRPAGTVSMDVAPIDPRDAEGGYNGSVIVDGVAYVVSDPAGRPAQLGALDLAAGAPVFPTVDLGVWANGLRLAHAGPEGLLLVAPGESSMIVVDPSSGVVRWQVAIDPVTAVLPTESAIIAYHLGTGLARALDWQTGAERWHRQYGVADWVSEAYPESLVRPGTAARTSSYPDRMVVGRRGSVDIIDTHTGDVLGSFNVERPENTQFIAGALYTNEEGEVWAHPLDTGGPPTLVYSDPDGEGGGVDWCGPSVLCVYDSSWFPGEDTLILLDLDTHRELARFQARGLAQVVGERVLTPDGLFDLAGNLLTDLDLTDAYEWWITASSVLTLTLEDDGARGVVRGLRTEDGATMLLGEIPLASSAGCSIDARYLVCPAPDGFHAWQFAEGPTR